MAERFDDLPIMAELGDALGAAFVREQAGARSPSALLSRLLKAGRIRGVGLLIVVALGFGATAAAAALVALRATVITAPATRDLAPTMRAVPGSGTVSTVTAADPDGGPRWSVRTTRSATGLTCSTVGQLVDGAFGIVGLDARFRVLPERIVDGCSTPVPGRATLLGVRVFDADAQPDVRTVLSGIAGGRLRSVRLRTPSGPRKLEIGAGGVFVASLRGYPEDSAPEVQLRFTDGTVQRRRFGAEPGIVRDPLGGPALQAELNGFSGSPQRCVRVFAARVAPGAPSGLNACVLPRRDAAFLAARRLAPGDRGIAGLGWDWKQGPRRTLAWGWTR
ncbi:MAG: hypothetical protein M3417_05215, partial [Actinomycetota bacterium]|nr:hypothetical protein [Actinomycetota bacterium]